MAKKEMKEMSFMDHLEDLRWLLVRSSAAIIIFASACYFIDGFIFDTIIFGPKNPSFITYRFFCEVTHFFGVDDTYACAKEFKFIIQNIILLVNYKNNGSYHFLNKKIES